MQVHRSLIITICLLVVAIIYAPVASGSDNENSVPLISNGTIANECGFGPPVVSIMGNGARCSGLLVHPEIVLYAQHCPTSGVTRVEFTHDIGNGHFEYVDYCTPYPGSWSVARDWAYCKLQEPYNGIPTIPAAYGCELDDYLNVNQFVTLCGFGAYNMNEDQDGRKRFGEGRISGVGSGGIDVGPYNGVTACPGDSGGPLLVQIADGSWRSLGITSVYNGICGQGGSNGYALIEGAVQWVEQHSGVDITPCFDSNGTWNPTSNCRGFWAGDNTQYGTWGNGCSGAPVSGYSDACGAPYSDGDVDTDTDSDTDADIDDYWVNGYCPGGTTGDWGTASDDCNGVTWEGCCDINGNVIWCSEDGTTLHCNPCGDYFCSWFEESDSDLEYYWCTETDNGPEPTGTHPIDCPEPPGTDTDVDTDTDTDTDTDSDGDTDIDTDGDGDTDGDSDIDTDSDSDLDTDTDPDGDNADGMDPDDGACGCNNVGSDNQPRSLIDAVLYMI